MTVDSSVRSLDFGQIATSADTKTAAMLSVVIPALNEQAGIADIIQRIESIRADLPSAGVNELEIIVVDDGSDDGTAEIVGRHPSVRLIQHPTNKGYGAAIKTGFSHARGDLLAFTDADGTYPPEHFPDLCRRLLTEDADVAVGSRRSGAESQMPPMRRLGNVIWSNLVSLMGNHRVHDPASGMRVLRRSALRQLYPLPDGLNFTPVMSTRAVHEELTVIEAPIPYAERIGDSKLSIVRDGTRFLKTIIWTALEYNPVRVLGFAGLAALGIAGLIALGFTALRLQGITTLGPLGVFTLFTALVLSVAGVSIFSLGATFNYLVSLFHKEPIHRGMFGRPIFDPPLDRHFGWFGLAGMTAGLLTAIASLVLSMNGWDITRLWFWLVCSALFSLVGLQLFVSWVVMRILEELSEREMHIEREMDANWVDPLA